MLDRRILREDDRGELALWSYLAKYDFVQIGALLVLLAIGITFIYSTGMQADRGFFEGFSFRQLIWIALGFTVYAATAHFDYRYWRVLGPVFYLVCLLLLVAVLFENVGTEVYGARRWLDLGPLLLQPSELMKLALVLVLAGLLEMPEFELNSYRGLGMVALAVLIPFVLIFREPDLGGALLLLPIGVAMIFVAGLKRKYIVQLLLAATALLLLATANEYFRIRPMLREYHINRIKGFFNPDAESLRDSNYQQKQAELAVGSGGMWGKGVGSGTQNLLGFLPATASNNDFIFSVIAEEVGFTGCLMVLLTYIILLYSILRTGYRCQDLFGKLMCTGIGMFIFVQMLVNVGVNIGLFPVTGLSLPFISYGGSFMLVGMAALGMVQSVWRHQEE